MHNYNPINKYGIKTRIGNWSEEWDLEETKYTFYYQGERNISGKRIVEFPKLAIKKEHS